jgi:ribosome biogenesis GTPase
MEGNRKQLFSIAFNCLLLLLIKKMKMTDLSEYGWNEELFGQKQNSIYKELEHARVTVTHKTCYEVVSEKGTFVCELSGNMMFRSRTSGLPLHGRRVIFQSVDTEKGIILDLLPRKKALYRLKSGTVYRKTGTRFACR